MPSVPETRPPGLDRLDEVFDELLPPGSVTSSRAASHIGPNAANLLEQLHADWNGSGDSRDFADLDPDRETIYPPPPSPEGNGTSMDGHALAAGPADFSYDGQDLEALADLPNYCRWILDGFGTHLRGRVVEVGAGIGNFAAHYVDRVDELVLVEPAANLYPRLEDRFATRTNVSTVCSYVDDWADDRQRGSFDAVVLVNVLEHVEEDGRMLRTLYSLLKPGGTLLLFVPAMQWLYGTLDAMVDHYRRYSRRGLNRELTTAGFDVAQLRYFDVAGVLPWYVMGRVLRRQKFDAAAATGFDRLVAPIMSRVERFLPLPFGKNLLALAKRPLEKTEQISEPALGAA